jgi:hypothetical protein
MRRLLTAALALCAAVPAITQDPGNKPSAESEKARRAAAGFLAGATDDDEQPKQPNIVFVLADDLGYRELGCFGQQKIETPRLDQLAREGMRLTRHYAGSPVCAPSRCVLMTGRHPGHAAVR